MQKGEFFISRDKEKIYQIAGRWGKEVVLVPVDDADEQVLIYTASELEELIGIGQFAKLHPIGIKVKSED